MDDPSIYLTPEELAVVERRVEKLQSAGIDINGYSSQAFIWAGIRDAGVWPRERQPGWFQEDEFFGWPSAPNEPPPYTPRPKVLELRRKIVIVKREEFVRFEKKRKPKPPPINPDGPCAVYKAYDAEDRLLYVGVTAKGVWRARQHGYRSEWWKLMARQEWEHFDNRDDALDRETELIATENPIYNKVRPTPGKERSRRAG